jgi:hypothetical protein
MLCDIAVSGTLSQHITTKHGKTTAKIPSTNNSTASMYESQSTMVSSVASSPQNNGWTGTTKCCLDQVHTSIDGGFGQECTREGAPSAGV